MGDARTGNRRPDRGASAARARDLLMLTLIALCLAALTALPVLARGERGEGPLSAVKVKRGETLWSIAAAVKGDRSTASTVAIIRAANDLRGSAVVAGQVIKVPAQGEETARADAR